MGDRRKCQTYTASPAEPGGLPVMLVFLSNRTEADFQAWRDERDWTERKYALWDAGKRLEPPSYGQGRTASNGTAREQAMKKISANPRFKEAPSSGIGYVIGGHKTTD